MGTSTSSSEMHSNFRSNCFFLTCYMKLDAFGQNFTTLENCWISKAVHGLASCNSIGQVIWSPESLKVGHFSKKSKNVKKGTNLAAGENLVFDNKYSKCLMPRPKKDFHMKPMLSEPSYTKFSCEEKSWSISETIFE